MLAERGKARADRAAADERTRKSLQHCLWTMVGACAAVVAVVTIAVVVRPGRAPGPAETQLSRSRVSRAAPSWRSGRTPMPPTALDPSGHRVFERGLSCSASGPTWLGRGLESLSAAQQEEVAVRAAAIAVEAADLPAPGDEHAVAAEVERLDVIAWDIQDGEAAASDAYDTAFRRARGVDAFALARFGRSPADAFFEALHALGAPADAGSEETPRDPRAGMSVPAVMISA